MLKGDCRLEGQKGIMYGKTEKIYHNWAKGKNIGRRRTVELRVTTGQQKKKNEKKRAGGKASSPLSVMYRCKSIFMERRADGRTDGKTGGQKVNSNKRQDGQETVLYARFLISWRQ